eukprot:338325-Pleurochrysis_carterae.AAC.1
MIDELDASKLPCSIKSLLSQDTHWAYTRFICTYGRHAASYESKTHTHIYRHPTNGAVLSSTRSTRPRC